MNRIISGITDFFRNIFQNVAEFFSGLTRPKRTGRRRSTSARNAVPQKHRSASRRRSAAKAKKAPAAGFFAGAGNAWKQFITWIMQADRKLLYAAGGALIIVIALPIVLVSVLGGGAEKDVPEETVAVVQTEAVETAAIAEDAAQIAVQTNIDGEAVQTVEGMPADGDEDVSADSSEEEVAEEIDPYAVDVESVYLQYQDDDPLVAKLQERLMQLGYMDEDIPTEHFGNNTRNAVIYFQRKHELTMDGAVGPQTYELLFSSDAKKYSMSEGAEGDDVKNLQSRLYELGYIESVTSYFGTDTVSAVKRFQELNKLTQDGSVGAQTLEVIYSSDVQANYLQYGSNNETVKKCQERLKKLGYLTTNADGNYGADTVNAVKRFQERNGLIADGFLGAGTKKLLLSGDALSNALVLGVSGSDVENVQKQLKKLGYMRSVTGYFGEGTEAAVIAFQKRNGLSADGKIGSQTMNKLFSNSAKKVASGGSSSSGSSSGGNNSSSGSSSGGASTDKVANKKDVASLIKVAKSKMGCKYVKGAKGPNTFDCSGFVYWCLNQIGVRQGYMTSGGWAANTKYAKVTSLGKVQAGDIVCFSGHVGIAIGGGQMIDASSSDGCIRITNLSLAYWKRNFKCAFRVL